MSEQDWRALLKAIIDDGTPIQEDADHYEYCRYCDQWESRKREHVSTCDWRKAEEALRDA